MDETEAAEAFFDIRIADIAMGSGHFLVAAVDRVERSFSAILAGRNLPGVKTELALLRAAAEGQLKKLGLDGTQQIEDGQLLRRLIARRCIYGVDLNPWRSIWLAYPFGSIVSFPACHCRCSITPWSKEMR